MTNSTFPGGLSYKLKQFVIKDLGILMLSITIQLICGLLLGHIYDIRISMATGFLVGTGQNPYIPQDLSSVFHNASFQNITTIGYPPPWPLLLGLIYRSTFAIIPNFLLYNLSIKLPILFANIFLAYLVADVIRKFNSDVATIRKAWIFMLLNPFLVYATTAWGQIDSIVAVLALSAIVLLYSGKLEFSALLLALAISFKPIALPLLLLPFLFLHRKSIRQVFLYYGLTIIYGILFCVIPFIVFKWDPSIILQNWNALFTVGGAMSYLVILEPIQNTYHLTGSWWLVGLIWIPALAMTAFLLRSGIFGLKDLLMKSTALIMVFFLTRSWLSEPNIILVLPFILILVSIKEIDRIKLTAVWLLPLLFSFFNTGTAQLFFPSMPVVMDKLLLFANHYRTLFLILKIAIVIPWQIMGWKIVIRCMKNGSTNLSMDRNPLARKGLPDEY